MTTNYRKELNILINSLKDLGKWAQFYKAAVVQPTFLLKRGLLPRKNLIITLKFLHRATTLEAYLEPSRRSTMEHFYKNNQRLRAVNNFRKNASFQMLHRVLNTPLSSEKLLQEWEYMTILSSLIIWRYHLYLIIYI